MTSSTSWPALVHQLSNAARNEGVQIGAVCYKVGRECKERCSMLCMEIQKDLQCLAVIPCNKFGLTTEGLGLRLRCGS